MRYLPLTDTDRQEMLLRVGVSSVDELYHDVPRAALLSAPIKGLPNYQGEIEVERILTRMARKSIPASSVPAFCGAGAYRHHVPASVDYLIQRGEFLTAYTPYQPEVSQGTLQVLFEFQTQVCMLTGMEVANASMYDGSTACAEAAQMAARVTRRGRVVVSGGLHPHYREILETTAQYGGLKTVMAPPDPQGIEDLSALIDAETAAVVVQMPGFFGHVRDLRNLARSVHEKGALLIVAVTEVVSLGLLEPPGAMGADIVVAEGQSLGVGLNFGGPYVGLFATRERLVRQMPGRLCGETVDAEGKRGFVLTLSTREQHIRREKATSNICTNSGLCALAFSIHLALLGNAGLTRLAQLNHASAAMLADRLAAVPGVELVTEAFFNEVTIRLPRSAAKVADELAGKGVLAGVPASRLYPNDTGMEQLLILAATELTTQADVDQLIKAMQESLR